MTRSQSDTIQRKKSERRGFDPGKVPPGVLARAIYPYLGKQSNRVIVGPGVGRDAAVVRFGRRVLVFSTDPITSATRHIGKHAIHVNANDVAVAGATPIWFLCTILVPPRSTESSLRHMMSEVHTEAKRLGIMVIRGHTEATPRLPHPILAGFMIGESRNSRFFAANNAREGDVIIMTKTAGIEGTALLASDHSTLLRKKGVSPSTIRAAERFLDRISVVPEARIASKIAGVTAMHDPTEGGILNGLWEVAEASDLGIRVAGEAIPIASETASICERLDLNPLKLLGSGSLIISCHPRVAERVLNRLRRKGVMATQVGRLTRSKTDREIELKNRNGHNMARLLPIHRDELYKV